MDHGARARELLSNFVHVFENPTREKMIEDAVKNRECIPLASGALATWTPPESTGRAPNDTFMVRRPESEKNIDWTSANCISMDPETFEMLFDDALAELSRRDRIYSVDRVVGADSKYALPVKVMTYRSLAALFIDTMFRPIPANINNSVFAEKPFTLLQLPYSKLDTKKYAGRLRKLPNGETNNMAVVIDYDKRVGIVYGTAYMGTMKKLIFTVMDYYLPEQGILPLHCSANEGSDGRSALLLGLSGTGKTTLSADPERALLGDDEHGWSNDGIANFENGCYAKLINLNPKKEPDIYKAVFHADSYLNHGAIIENAMVFPDGTFDLNDGRLTENSRVGFPLSFLSNIKTSSCSGHPTTILFLTADAYGVLPPVARLTADQAMLWFMMGYTSKLAGTETGVTEPSATFSRFFGGPFMPRNPSDYAELLGKKMKEHSVSVYLVNTGWSGGGYGVGKRMDINLTRAMVRAALNGTLKDSRFVEDPVFKMGIPQTCPGVPAEVLNPENTWADKAAFKDAAQKLSAKFSSHFDKNFAGKVSTAIASQCPGK
jgi:phosphoenolpyruvate carboxykinase (ATP)